MLKRRITRIEKGLGLKKISIENIEDIYKFFLTGDESLLPEELELREVQIATNKAADKGLKEYPGLSRVFNALKKGGEIADDERDFFEYIKTREKRVVGPCIISENEKNPDEILGKLRLGPSLIIQYVKVKAK